MDLRALDQNVAHAALLDLVEQLREGDVLRRRALARILEQREQRQQQEDDDHPEGEIAQIGVHPRVLCRRGARSLSCAGKLGPIHVRPDHNLSVGPPPAKGTRRISPILPPFHTPRLPYSAVVKISATGCDGPRRRALDHEPAGGKRHQRARQRAAQAQRSPRSAATRSRARS